MDSDIFFVFFGLFFVTVIGFISLSTAYKSNKTPCSTYKDTAVRYLPARCLHYYNTQSYGK